jgi:hypothetical protein
VQTIHVAAVRGCVGSSVPVAVGSALLAAEVDVKIGVVAGQIKVYGVPTYMPAHVPARMAHAKQQRHNCEHHAKQEHDQKHVRKPVRIRCHVSSFRQLNHYRHFAPQSKGF